jgi:AcrR family transcriptional regulator
MAAPLLRSDAQRNVDRVLEAAMNVLGANPVASVEQVAAASGVHRSTVYRRFPTREALVRALLERALSEVSGLVATAARGEPSEDKLRELCVEVLALGERYAFLQWHYRTADLGPDPIGLTTLIRRYQRAGVLRADLPAQWVAAAFTALVGAQVESGEGLDRADHLLAETFLRGASR